LDSVLRIRDVDIILAVDTEAARNIELPGTVANGAPGKGWCKRLRVASARQERQERQREDRAKRGQPSRRRGRAHQRLRCVGQRYFGGWDGDRSTPRLYARLAISQ